MKYLQFLLVFALMGLVFMTSCDDDDDMMSEDTLELDIDGLQNLGDDYAYEGWILVDGSPVTTGVFTVDDNGNLSQTSFTVDETDLANATAFILTIEPSPDNDPAPSNVHLIAGNFNGATADLSVGHGAAIGTDFSSAEGGYILATPTNGNMTNENSGIWFLDPSGPSASLTLPALPDGWKYEGWAVSAGTPITTGKFDTASGADEFDGYSSDMNMAPPFPGEDFLQNAPSGITFPLDLSGGMAVISVEPDPDNSPAPFVLKPLVGNIPSGAADHTLYDMNNNATNTNPDGVATR